MAFLPGSALSPQVLGESVTFLPLCRCHLLDLSIRLCRLPPLEVPSGYRGLAQHHWLPCGGTKGWDFYCTAFPIKTDSVPCLVAQSCPTLCDRMHCSPPGSSLHRDSPGKSTGVGCHALFQGILPTQGSNPGFLHCR